MNIAIGQKVGRWTVVGEAPSRVVGQKRPVNIRFLNCRCDCGAEREVNANNVLYGRSLGCGCRHLPSGITHGKSRTPEYSTWATMRRRCLNATAQRYSDYGGRGITVCERWGEFENFYADMGDRPSNKHSLERKDNDGPYSPENCIWATWIEQANNTRSNRWIELDGRKLTTSQWARELGISRSLISMRLQRGWPTEKVLDPKRHHPFGRATVRISAIGR